jgi:hypothetical protein
MHNVDVAAVEASAAAAAAADPAAMVNPVAFEGTWQTTEGAPQFRAEIPVPRGGTVTFEADFPPPWAERAAPRTRSPTASGTAWPATP